MKYLDDLCFNFKFCLFGQLDDSFGEDIDLPFDDDELLEPPVAMCVQEAQELQTDVDENMNNIAIPNIDHEFVRYETEVQQPIHDQNEDSTMESDQREKMPSLLRQLQPVQQSTIVASKINKKKRRSTIFMDEDNQMAGKMMKKRISKYIS